VIASTLERAGCHPKDDNNVGAALLTYRPDGRTGRIELPETGLTAPCKTAFTALVRLVVAERDYGAVDTAQTVVLPITRGFAACTSEPEAPAARQPVGGEIKTPRKIRDVKPVYPLRAQQDRIQGAVLIEARVTAGGCVNSARIVRSIPALNLAALRAVLDWTYEPARLDGWPVPIVMTITVNFTLQ
jgi:TonB family protein